MAQAYVAHRGPDNSTLEGPQRTKWELTALYAANSTLTSPIVLGAAFFAHPGDASSDRRRRQKWTIGMIRMATMLATLIIGLIAGPAVSL